MNFSSPGVYIKETDFNVHSIKGVSTSTAAFIGVTSAGDEQINKAVLISDISSFNSIFGVYTTTAPYMAPSVSAFFSNGGHSCYIIKVVENELPLDILDSLSDVNLILMPGITDTTLQNTLLQHCQTHKDRFCILDSQKESNLNAVQAQRNSLISSDGFGALYYPWIKMQVEINSAIFVPPSGFIAGVYARVDSARGVHKVPANEVLNGAIELEKNLSNAQQAPLNALGVNAIRSFGSRGIRVWAARTLANDASYKYINVRRLLIYLETSIKNSTQWVVFEPNSENLWANLEQIIEKFLVATWRNGALVGSTPKEAFFVQCNRNTMSQNDINNGKIITLIGVAAQKPAEFVIFKIVHQINN